MTIEQSQAREFLLEHKIELAIEDPRSAVQYVGELILYAATVNMQTESQSMATNKLAPHADQYERPYFG